MFCKLLVLLAVLCVVAAKVEMMNFKDLEADTTMKFVLFHDPKDEKSMSLLETMETLSGTPSEYLWKACDVSDDEDAKTAGLTGGMIFTHTPEAGIDQFDGELTQDSFRAFHDFRMSEVEDDNVVSTKKLSKIFRLAEEKPVFIKLFEQWCGHCKKMKKHFQWASAQPKQSVHYVEVECSAADSDLCQQFGVSGYPTVKLLAKTGDGKYKVHTYNGARTNKALADFGASAVKVAKKSGDWKNYKGKVPDLS
jgi:thiol-disulfide isomerase/thioredoxin